MKDYHLKLLSEFPIDFEKLPKKQLSRVLRLYKYRNSSKGVQQNIIQILDENNALECDSCVRGEKLYNLIDMAIRYGLV